METIGALIYDVFYRVWTCAIERYEAVSPERFGPHKKKIGALGRNLPNPNTTKMKRNNSFHKIRSGDYRIIYEIHDDKLVVLIIKVRHRKDVYKSL